jgi:pimeloyl-ACP methyl ester carboxylesterase
MPRSIRESLESQPLSRLVLAGCRAGLSVSAIVLYRPPPGDWMMKIRTVKGAAGVNLHVREYGNSRGVPILLIHGWSQSHLCWSKQYDSALNDVARIVALDLRGHGMSDVPTQMDQYTDGEKWADDIAAVIDQLALDQVILVGWSYGGYIILDYVLRKGQSKIAGINFVAAAVVLGPKAFGGLSGERTRGLRGGPSHQYCRNSQVLARLHRQANLKQRFRGNVSF